MLRNVIDCKSLEYSQKNIMMKFMLVKLHVYSLNTANTTLNLTTNSCRNKSGIA